MTTRTFMSITLGAAISLVASQSLASPQTTATSNQNKPTIAQLLDSGTPGERGAKIGTTAVVGTGIIGAFGAAAVRAGGLQPATATPSITSDLYGSSPAGQASSTGANSWPGTSLDAETTAQLDAGRAQALADSQSGNFTTVADKSPAFQDGYSGGLLRAEQQAKLAGNTTEAATINREWNNQFAGGDGFTDGQNAAAQALEDASRAGEKSIAMPTGETPAFEAGFRDMVEATNTHIPTANQFSITGDGDVGTGDAAIADTGDAYLDGQMAAYDSIALAADRGETSITMPAGESSTFQNGFRDMVKRHNVGLSVDDNDQSITITEASDASATEDGLGTSTTAMTSDHPAYTAGMDQAAEDIKTGTAESVADQSLDFQRGYSFGITKAEMTAEAAGNIEELDKLAALRKTAFGADSEFSAPAFGNGGDLTEQGLSSSTHIGNDDNPFLHDDAELPTSVRAAEQVAAGDTDGDQTIKGSSTVEGAIGSDTDALQAGASQFDGAAAAARGAAAAAGTASDTGAIAGEASTIAADAGDAFDH